jgi:Protein of unknown function (DUF3891)
VRDYLRREQSFQYELLETLRADTRYAPHATNESVARNRRLVARFDGISLALCHALRFEHAHEGVPTADGEVTIVVSPVGGDGREYVVDPWPSRDEASRSGTRDAASTAGSRTTRRCERRSAGLHG